ncbi:MAG: CDP-diacylglycerol--serine O-phosphatidyltransferase [Bacteroidetes bacterium]|nr:CDP-diacylglycerol--serine O-phosphatidyltransferase [Bacteroidota bacterium]
MKKHLPNFITVLNLLSGCMALLAVFNDNLVQASWWVILAAIFDLLDGLIARLFNAVSDIGKQLDSLADVVSFGVAPAFILFNMINTSAALVVPGHGDLHFLSYAAFLIPVFAAIRLAKFNIDTDQTYNFKGLPTPAVALFILSLPIIMNCDLVVIPWLNSMIASPWVLAGLAVVLSALMLSPLPLFSLKFRSIYWKYNRARFILIVFSLILFFLIRFASVPFIMLAYIILSLLKLNEEEGTGTDTGS